MNRVKKKAALIFTFCLCIGLSACGNSAGKTETIDKDVAQNEVAGVQESKVEETENEETADVLVVVFSATGTTKGVAEKIASIEGADLYEIIPAEPYSDEDLNWNDSNSRTTREQNDSSVRPEIASETVDLSGYSRIYVGYPIWWGEEPRIMDTFVESYDFGDATIIPFCTSSSSGIGKSGKNLADNAEGGNWLDGARFSGRVSEDELRTWINNMK